MSDATQEFLDNSQYTRAGVLKYEFVFGHGFLSPGGPESTQKLFAPEMLNPPPVSGSTVLDVGCGIGGGCDYLNKTFGAKVLGIDLATECINIAQERFASNDDLQFKVADALDHPLPDNHFDLIYSRDSILHINSKVALFTRLFAATKPGGRLYFTDYTCGEKEVWDESFHEYVKQRGYTLLTTTEHKQVLEEAGWVVDKAEDASEWFTAILTAEKESLLARKEEFLIKYPKYESEFRDLIDGWDAKLLRVAQGQQKWGLFLAHKN